jgi:hypothetical protein
VEEVDEKVEKEIYDHRQHEDDEIARHRAIACQRERTLCADYVVERALEISGTATSKVGKFATMVRDELKRGQHL